MKTFIFLKEVAVSNSIREVAPPLIVKLVNSPPTNFATLDNRLFLITDIFYLNLVFNSDILHNISQIITIYAVH